MIVPFTDFESYFSEKEISFSNLSAPRVWREAIAGGSLPLERGAEKTLS